MEKTKDTTISQLPDELLNHILSFLPIEVAFRMSFLSKRWKNIWDTNTLLSLDLNTIFKYSRESPKVEILDFVDKYLLMQEMNNVNIQSFKLHIQTFDSQFAIYMNIWVERLIRCNVKYISFRSSLCNGHNYPHGYSFPQAILSAESLTKLNLDGCRLECVESADIKLVSLKELFLKYVIISNESIELLIKSCTAVEHLYLDTCQGVTSLKVAGLRGLNTLTLVDNLDLKRVEIDEPSLVRLFLRFNEWCADHNDLKFTNCTGLKKLILFNSYMSDEWLSRELLVLDHLEDLELFFCRKIRSLNISSSHLKRLLLVHRDELSTVHINTPKLKSFSLSSMYKSNKKLLSISLNAPHTLEVELDIYAQVISCDWYIDLLNFVSSFDHSRLTLKTNLLDSIIPDAWIDGWHTFHRERAWLDSKNFGLIQRLGY